MKAIERLSKAINAVEEELDEIDRVLPTVSRFRANSRTWFKERTRFGGHCRTLAQARLVARARLRTRFKRELCMDDPIFRANLAEAAGGPEFQCSIVPGVYVGERLLGSRVVVFRRARGQSHPRSRGDAPFPGLTGPH